MGTTKKRVVWLGGIFFAVVCMSVNASLIPVATDWSVNITTLTERGSPAATTSITDIADGVLLQYNAATGGSGVGTSTRQYDFTTTAAATGALMLTIDVTFNAFTGFFGNQTALDVLQNGAVIQTLVPLTAVEPGVNRVFEDVMLSLNAADTWGIRAIAGNFDRGSGVSGRVRVTAVPEPSTLALLSIGLVGLGWMGRRRTKA